MTTVTPSHFKSHPWHGLSAGDKAPHQLVCYVEMVPADTVKYEIEKESGFLMIDRPQKFSNHCPSLYGFVPQTYCGDETAMLAMERSGRKNLVGDGDPLDICILTERFIPHGDILVKAIPIGGFRMIDDGEADEKIVAVLQGDSMYGHYREIEECPAAVLDRLRHYFLTYKLAPGESTTHHRVQIDQTYGRQEAIEVLKRSFKDYQTLIHRRS